MPHSKELCRLLFRWFNSGFILLRTLSPHKLLRSKTNFRMNLLRRKVNILQHQHMKNWCPVREYLNWRERDGRLQDQLKFRPQRTQASSSPGTFASTSSNFLFLIIHQCWYASCNITEKKNTCRFKQYRANHATHLIGKIDPQLQRTHTKNKSLVLTVSCSSHLLFFVYLSLQLLHADAQLGVFLLLLIRFFTLSFKLCDLNTHLNAWHAFVSRWFKYL